MLRTKKGGAIAAVACGALLCAPAAASAADAVYGLTDANRIVRFNTDAPGKVLQTVPVQGLEQGETLVGIDVRPANDTLYAVGTPQPHLPGQPGHRRDPPHLRTRSRPALNGASFGVDFNPVADALRIVSDAEQNLRVPFSATATPRTTTPLQYAAGDPGAGSNPVVGGAGYTNTFPGATETALYDIDTGRDVLVRQNPANAGTLATVGPLGVDADATAGFDVSPQGNIAYAALKPAGQARASLYRVDLTSGAATPVSQRAVIGTDATLRGIAVATGGVDDDRTAPEMSVAFSSTILESEHRTR